MLPSAPQTPPAAIISICAPVRCLIASISVKTSPGIGSRHGTWASGEFIQCQLHLVSGHALDVKKENFKRLFGKELMLISCNFLCD
jgi:hypothetical protein